MLKTRHVLKLFLLLAGVIFVTAGCGATNGTEEQNTSAINQHIERNHLVITDTAGREVSIETPVERVAILDTGTAEILKALGVLDKLVGSHEALVDHPMYPELEGVPAVATYSEVNMERLAETMPQVVFSSVRSHGVIGEQDQLQGFGIADVKLNLRNPEHIKEEVLLLGKIFGKQEEAQKLVDFYEEHEQFISSRVEQLSPDERKQVFVEYHAGNFMTGAPGSRFYEQIVLAGADNLAASLSGEPEVSAEWVAESNPDVIVREVSTFGYDVDSDEEAAAIYGEIMQRPGLLNTNAVKNEAVYLLSTEIYSRPAYIVGVSYLAKWLYPERFEDFDPEDVHRAYMELVHPDIPYQGLWAYSGAGKE